MPLGGPKHEPEALAHGTELGTDGEKLTLVDTRLV